MKNILFITFICVFTISSCAVTNKPPELSHKELIKPGWLLNEFSSALIKCDSENSDVVLLCESLFRDIMFSHSAFDRYSFNPYKIKNPDYVVSIEANILGGENVNEVLQFVSSVSLFLIPVKSNQEIELVISVSNKKIREKEFVYRNKGSIDTWYSLFALGSSNKDKTKDPKVAKNVLFKSILITGLNDIFNNLKKSK